MNIKNKFLPTMRVSVGAVEEGGAGAPSLHAGLLEGQQSVGGEAVGGQRGLTSPQPVRQDLVGALGGATRSAEGQESCVICYNIHTAKYDCFCMCIIRRW